MFPVHRSADYPRLRYRFSLAAGNRDAERPIHCFLEARLSDLLLFKLHTSLAFHDQLTELRGRRVRSNFPSADDGAADGYHSTCDRVDARPD